MYVLCDVFVLLSLLQQNYAQNKHFHLKWKQIRASPKKMNSHESDMQSTTIKKMSTNEMYTNN